MSLQIYIAFTGARLKADPISFSSLEALRSWVENNASIPASRQILMTAKGKNVKQQHLLTEVWPRLLSVSPTKSGTLIRSAT